MRVAEITPIYRRRNVPELKLSRMVQSIDIYEYAKKALYSDLNGMCYDEKAFAIFLNNDLRVIAHELISIGGINETLVDVKKIMHGALLSNASLIAFVHNHPSGNPKPSRLDDMLTSRIKDACKLMGFKFIDHIIASDNEAYYSYLDECRL